MAGFSTDQDRKVIPRWRTFVATLRHGELESVAPPRSRQQVSEDPLASKLRDWSEHRTVGHASDLVGAGLMLNRMSEVADAAKFLLQDDLHASPWAKDLAKKALMTPEEDEVLIPMAIEEEKLREQVRILRGFLHIGAKDPITWVELSRAYAILGLEKQAARSMTVALHFAMNNRFVLRSASRLWVHLGDFERARDLLAKADRTRHDPWLLAAEIAIGSIEDKTPRFTKAARRMLTGGYFSPNHMSELASAMATLELSSGSLRKSKRLFMQSLEHPTENSIAQAAWAARRHTTIRFSDEYLNRPNTFEARSWSFYLQGQWKRVIEECKLWHYDQPFSSRPCHHGSYVSAVALEDFEASEWFAERGLMANPADFTLLNNLAFARINRGDMDRARETFLRIERLRLSEIDRAVLQATKGLFEFRFGNVERGRQLYSDTRSEVQRMSYSDGDRVLALASFFYAMEEVSGKHPSHSLVADEALDILKPMEDPIFRLLEQRLIKTTNDPRRRSG